MTTRMLKNGKHRALIPRIFSVVLLIALLLMGGCSFVQHSIARLRSTDNFIPSKNDSRVLFEPGAEEYVSKIEIFMPLAIQQVEKKQYRYFLKPVHVYVCASRESFKKYYGADVRAGVSNKLFVSPRIFEYGDVIAEKYLTHELSHLHLLQQTGLYNTIRLPMWFKEGWATYVSNGGGAHLISENQAIESIRAGGCFFPNKAGGIIFKTTPSDFDLKPHMFYRQSMMYISFLATINNHSFRELLLAIEDGESLSTVFKSTYNKSIEESWNEFLYKIKEKG